MNKLVIKTKQDQWVIPYDCSLLKAVLNAQNMAAEDLVFTTSSDCQQFIKDVSLLATLDELNCGNPSSLTLLTQQLIAIQSDVSTHLSSQAI